MKIVLVNSDKPIFTQIAEAIENAILNGVIEEETQIPSTIEISQINKVNPATVNKGYNILVDEGIIYKKRGIGMFVMGGAILKIKEKRVKKFKEDFILPIIDESKFLNISIEELKSLIKENWRD